MLFHSKTNSTRAFGLVELMVSISIMGLITSLIVARQSSFNGAVLLRNQAYELAFALRQMQLLAVSGGDESVRTYGVYLDAAGNDKVFTIFKDSNKNGQYDSGESLAETRLDSRFEVRGVYDSSGAVTGNTMSLTFTRPNFDAKAESGSGVALTGPFYIDVARVGVVTNGTGDVRRVEVTSTGQITVVPY